MARSWEPSKRAQELLSALWDAFEAGDRWVRLQSKTTARYTGCSLVWNGLAEFDMTAPYACDGYSTRIRLSTECLALNGYPTRDSVRYRADLAEMDAEDEVAA